jgi:GTP-binding protein Era
VFVDTPGFQTRHSSALNKSLNKTVLGAIDGVDLVLFVVEAGSFTLADAKVLSLLKPGTPTLLVANKLDTVHRRAELAPWLKSMQERHPFAEFVPMSAKNPRDVERLLDLRALPARAALVLRRGRADRPQREVPGQRDGARKAVPPDGRRAALHLHRGDRQVRGKAVRTAAWCASPPPSWSSATATRP